MGLVVRYHFVSRLVSTSDVKTPALVRDQLQVWLHNYRIEVLDTTVVLKQTFTNVKQPLPLILYSLRSSIVQVGTTHAHTA